MSALSRFGPAATRLSYRGYSSPAVAQLEYCYNEEGLTDAWEREGRGVQWVIIGDPTVKRRVYADGLAKLLEVPHISMRCLVRQELNPNSCVYKKIASAVNGGKLVPEEVIFGLLWKKLEEGRKSGFILDGIPRTRFQAEILDQIADIDLVVNLKQTSDNGICSSTPTSCHHIYSQQMKMIEEYYHQKNKLLNFPVSPRPLDTWEGLLAALQLRHLTNPSTNKLSGTTF